ncbi:MAG: hypothetical protein ACRY3E_00130 [Candidatus Lariskella arthropodorum]
MKSQIKSFSSVSIMTGNQLQKKGEEILKWLCKKFNRPLSKLASGKKGGRRFRYGKTRVYLAYMRSRKHKIDVQILVINRVSKDV